MTADCSWEAEELGRLLHTHRIDPDLVVGPPDLVEHGTPNDPCGRAALLLNVLVRVEIRCAGDSVAIRATLDRPLDALAGDSIADRLRAGPDLAGLRLLREVAGTMPVARVKMWRVPDRYS